jgi:P-type Cu+ transporter
MLTVTFLVTNLHCPSCVSLVQDVLGPDFPGLRGPVEVSLIRQTIRCLFDEAVSDVAQITTALTDSAFEVRHITVENANGQRIAEEGYAPPPQHHPPTWSRMERRTQRAHIDNCDACKKEKGMLCINSSGFKGWPFKIRSRLYSSSSTSSPVPADVEKGATDQAAVAEAGGVQLDDADGEERDCVVTIAIDGMTCSSCVATITRGLENVPIVSKISIDLVSNSGTFTIKGKTKIQELIDGIEDLGYGAEVVSTTEDKPIANDVGSTPEATGQRQQQRERTVELQVGGMHCNNCPDRIADAISKLASESGGREGGTKILQRPSIRNPIMQVAYLPDGVISIRSIIRAVADVDPAFTVSIYHQPTLEERSRRLQQAEKRSILYRLLFAGVIAIPTFIIGVVYMSLVPKHNKTRMWFEEPIWGGDVTRIEWSLFIITTPVMFFGADLFHRRAAKEIWVIWKPGSKFPYLRRLYRFGSMNLLISAATMVAYVSSFGVLVANAVQSPAHHATMSNTYFDAVTFLTFFILIGRYLEAYSKAKTGDAVTMLGQLKPREATLVDVDGSSHETVPVDQLELYDLVMVQRGQSPPADGLITVEGTFSFDESSLTGESRPVTKRKGDVVYAGTMNIGDPVTIKVSEVGGTSMLDHIISVVRSGQAKRAPIERVADVITGYFVPVITLLAIITWVIWLSLGLSGSLSAAWLETKQGGWAFWSLEFAIAVFVIACPCGIGLAAPTALFVGGGMAARSGVLVHGGGQAFQEAAHVDAVVFDKTGTLTQGEMKVVDCDDYSDWSHLVNASTALAIAKALEANSTHPVAQAVVKHVDAPTSKISLSDITEVPGQGMKAKVTIQDDGETRSFDAAIGSEDLIEKLNEHDAAFESQHAGTEQSDREHTVINTSLYFMRKSIQNHQLQGHSIAILSIRPPETVTNRYYAVTLFAIADPLRPEAPAVIEDLRSRGISVHMCTGDNPITALAIATQLSLPITHVRPSALPQDKAAYIQALQQSEYQMSWNAEHYNADIQAAITAAMVKNPYTAPTPQPQDAAAKVPKRRIIAFVGDGLNDAPALSAADVSISLSSGSDIAINASSFILLRSDLSLIPALLNLSRRVFRRVKLNFAWALVYNVTLIPVAAGVFFPLGATSSQEGWRLSPVWASLAMACSSVSVVGSSLALRLPELRMPKSKASGKGKLAG